MPKLKNKKKGDIGIRLKPIETNLLENYNEFSNRRKKTKKKKKKKRIKKPKTKRIEVHKKVDPLFKIIEESKEKDKSKEEIKIKEIPDIEKPKIDKPNIEKIEEIKPQFKKVKVQEGKRDISEKDPNIKTLEITASIKPEKKKEGAGILLE